MSLLKWDLDCFHVRLSSCKKMWFWLGLFVCVLNLPKRERKREKEGFKFKTNSLRRNLRGYSAAQNILSSSLSLFRALSCPFSTYIYGSLFFSLKAFVNQIHFDILFSRYTVSPIFQISAIPGIFFFIFQLFNAVDTKQMFNISFGRWLDSNRGPKMSEATSQPTEPSFCCILSSRYCTFV